MSLTRKELDEICKKIADSGRLIEAGWKSFMYLTIPMSATPTQVEEMRNAFFAGAQHLFGSCMQFLDDGEEATEKDLQRMTYISIELNTFIAEFKKSKGF